MGLSYGRALPLETKQLDGDAWEVAGYLSTFGNQDQGGDIILSGAFDATLASGRKVKFLWGHDDLQVLGPPLDLRVDDHGLFAHGRISRTTLGADIHTLLLDGAIDSWSIGYVPKDVGFKEGDDERGLVRLLKAVDLFEGSLVAVPMNEQALVTGVKQHPGAGLDYETHAAQVVDGVEEFLGRTRHGAERRVKEGRAISSARRDRMASVSGSLRQAADEIDAMLTETAPPEKAAAGYSPRLALNLAAARLRLRGVPVEG